MDFGNSLAILNNTSLIHVLKKDSTIMQRVFTLDTFGGNKYIDMLLRTVVVWETNHITCSKYYPHPKQGASLVGTRFVYIFVGAGSVTI